MVEIELFIWSRFFLFKVAFWFNFLKRDLEFKFVLLVLAEVVTKLVFAPLCPYNLGVIKVGDVVFCCSLVPPPTILHYALDTQVIVSIAYLVLIEYIFLSLYNLTDCLLVLLSFWSISFVIYFLAAFGLLELFLKAKGVSRQYNRAEILRYLVFFIKNFEYEFQALFFDFLELSVVSEQL